MLLKCTQYASKFGKLSSGHRTGKVQFSFQSQRKAMPKKDQTTTQLHSSHMLKILQARLQQYVNWELPDVQGEFRKEEEPEIKLPTPVDVGKNICVYRKSKRIPEKKHLLLFHWLHQSLCVDHNKLCKILKEIKIPGHLTCCLRNTDCLRNLYAGQEATVRTVHGTMDWFQIEKGIRQGCILSPCLFSLCAQYIMWNAGLDEAQAEIKIVGKISISSDIQMIPP